jgi:hypothetical protein
MRGAGLVKITDEDENIIPNYFEPFLRENVDILYFASKEDGFRLFKVERQNL